VTRVTQKVRLYAFLRIIRLRPASLSRSTRRSPKERRGNLFLLNASREFVKGDPKNYLPDDAILRIAYAFAARKELEKYSRIVSREEIAKNDFNISPSRYIHTGEADEYRPIAEIVEELEALSEESKATDTLLKDVLTKLAV
jgi:type I restriction enzyme M protein